jgi:hypothetical protein
MLTLYSDNRRLSKYYGYDNYYHDIVSLIIRHNNFAQHSSRLPHKTC